MLERMRNAKCVIYNRIAKTGSSTTNFIIERMAKKNKFKEIYSRNHGDRAPNSRDLNILNKKLANAPKPWVYIRHIYFWDASFIKPAPVFINTVRDPVERITSGFYWNRRFNDKGTGDISFDECVKRYWPHKSDKCFLKSMQNYAIQFFCGPSLVCANASREALNIAKLNVRRHYAVVADLSDFSTFFQVLEFGMPHLFKGASQLYYSNFHTTKVVKNKGGYSNAPSFETVNILKRDLSLDYEFYYFIRQRYYKFVHYLHQQGMAKSYAISYVW